MKSKILQAAMISFLCLYPQINFAGAKFFNVRNWKKLLPENKDQTMVFYCVNKLCTASEMAAREVMKLGYTDVRQMPDGIEGWKLSGRKVERP